jgi:transcriptional regulator with XRE-family HTH domain
MKRLPKDLLGRRVREIREAAGVSQDALAAAAHIAGGQQYVWKIEEGLKYPGLEMLSRIANALHVNVAEFLEGGTAPFADPPRVHPTVIGEQRERELAAGPSGVSWVLRAEHTAEILSDAMLAGDLTIEAGLRIADRECERLNYSDREREYVRRSFIEAFRPPKPLADAPNQNHTRDQPG